MRDDDAATPVRQDPERASVGTILREAREARHLSLLQVSEELRIEPQSLSALEEDRFDAIGAPVFVKGYLKNYADCLGLDPRRLLEIYRGQRGDEEPVVRARRALGQEQDRSMGTWVVAAVAAMLIGAFLWIRSPSGDDPEPVASAALEEELPEPGEPADAGSALPPPIDTRAPEVGDDAPHGALRQSLDSGAASETAAAEPSAAPRQEPLAATDAPPDAGASRATSSGPAAAGDAEAAPSAGAQPIDAGSAGAASAGAAGSSAETVAPPADSSAAAVPAAAAGALEIELRFIEDSWVEVTGPDDERLYYGLGRAGTAARFSGSPPIDVLLGNADGVTMRVDGEPFSYPPSSRRGNLARFTLFPGE